MRYGLEHVSSDGSEAWGRFAVGHKYERYAQIGWGREQQMNRRRFMASAAASSLLYRTGAGQGGDMAAAAVLALTGAPAGPTIPADFTGLSYEAAQLANPDFFAPGNHQLVELFRGLSPSGNLRLGGGSSEFNTYSDVGPGGPPPFEVFGPDTSKTVKHGTVTTALALGNLRGFLDATNWSCLYGLNLGQGTKENAAVEAAAVRRILGPRLLAFQIGNEPDSFRNRYRPADYAPADFMKEWNTFHDAIVALVPGVKFAGPDISNKFAYMTAFGAEAPAHPDVMLMTAHFYAMGPAGSPNATLDQLLDPDPKLATMHIRNLPVVTDAIKASGLPFRMTEGNSCWDGGKPGVSDTFASALWCAEMMLRFARMGWVGVNLHGGGNGFYTPIAGAPSTGFTRRPEYTGIQFAQRLVGGTFLPSTLTGATPRVTAHVLQVGGRRRVAVFNKELSALELELPGRPDGQAFYLTAPSLESKDGAAIVPVKVARRTRVTVPATTAALYTLA
jgi:hypothetical protein